ncbi:MAG: ATP-binding protein [Sideroxydans sp.]|jgi:PAS domain S-box-containing protein
MTQQSLAKRLTFFLIATIITISLATGSGFYLFSKRQIDRELNDKAQVTLDYLTGSLAEPLWALNEAIIKQIGDTVAQDPDISSIEVLDSSRSKRIFFFQRTQDAGALQISESITHQGFPVGEVRISLSRHPFEERLTELLWSLLAIIVIITFVLALSANAMIRLFLRYPFAELTRMVDAYGRGDYEITADTRYLEFKPLTQLLEAMGRKIDDQLGLLKENNLELERRVDERTAALAASEAHFRLLVEQSPDGIFLSDSSGRFVDVNSVGAAMLGYTCEEILNLSIHDIHVEEEIPHIPATIARYAEGSVVTSEWVFKRKDGSTFVGELVARQLPDGRLQGILRDISDRKKAEAEILRARDLAESASRVKSDFIANMSHELRTPMNAIIGMSHLLIDTNLSPRQHGYLMKIQKSSQHLLDMVNDVLDFSKIEAGKMNLDCAPFVLDHLLNDVAALYPDKTVNKQLTLSFIVEPDVPHHLIGDFTKLKQILINLLSNAIKFTPQGEINVGVRLESDTADGLRLRFAVSDTGLGISQEQISRLFQSFQQADSSTTRKYGGTGLGLAISKRLVELMGGAIDVSSELGRGSTFWFTVPLERDSGIAQMPPWVIANEPVVDRERLTDIAGARVLVVDDDPLNQETLRLLIEQLGLAVDVVGDGATALQHLEGRGPDDYALIMMEMHMPEMDGATACAAIRRLPSWTDRPIVGITANVAPAVRTAGLQAGMNEVIDRPVTQTALYPTLLRWIAPRPHFNPPTSVVDTQELARVCQALAQQLAGNELRAKHTLDDHAELLRAASPQAFEEIKAAIEDIDFERALAALTAMTQIAIVDT